MEKIDNILKNLQHVKATPPPDAWSRLLNTVEKHQHAEEQLLIRLKELSNYQQRPPADLYDKIFAAVQKNVSSKVISPVIDFFIQYRQVAAAAVLLLLGYFAYLFISGNFNSQKPQEMAVKPSPITTPEQPTDSSVIVDTIFTSGEKKGLHLVKKIKIPLKKKYYGLDIETENAFESSVVMVDGKSFEIKDNNLIFTFASFKYDEVPSVLLNTSDENVYIQVDNYTSLAVNKNMRSLIKQMYKTRKNGSFTRKASRYRKKLTDWQNADDIKFDSTLNYNPLDPFDLGDFILQLK